MSGPALIAVKLAQAQLAIADLAEQLTEYDDGPLTQLQIVSTAAGAQRSLVLLAKEQLGLEDG